MQNAKFSKDIASDLTGKHGKQSLSAAIFGDERQRKKGTGLGSGAGSGRRTKNEGPGNVLLSHNYNSIVIQFWPGI